MKKIADKLTNSLGGADSAKLEFEISQYPDAVLIAIDGDDAELRKLMGIDVRFYALVDGKELQISGVGISNSTSANDRAFLVTNKLPVFETLVVRIRGIFNGNISSANISTYILGIGDELNAD